MNIKQLADKKDWKYKPLNGRDDRIQFDPMDWLAHNTDFDPEAKVRRGNRQKLTKELQDTLESLSAPQLFADADEVWIIDDSAVTVAVACWTGRELNGHMLEI